MSVFAFLHNTEVLLPMLLHDLAVLDEVVLHQRVLDLPPDVLVLVSVGVEEAWLCVVFFVVDDYVVKAGHQHGFNQQH
eukprot:CAMPEP_0173198826 /NCGR_PEP_ID=MMETSP1141-20130122/16899_1 /TAXON_ID=483371 /ORGANISM="non described non described, Strain CCMP2298" /LENGTH=77 /DNA_ID=CAMNT_0014123655 /DNA_START=346 /DNA_END=579 /DNA_ORIENTATION=-